MGLQGRAGAVPHRALPWKGWGRGHKQELRPQSHLTWSASIPTNELCGLGMVLDPSEALHPWSKVGRCGSTGLDGCETHRVASCSTVAPAGSSGPTPDTRTGPARTRTDFGPASPLLQSQLPCLADRIRPEEEPSHGLGGQAVTQLRCVPSKAAGGARLSTQRPRPRGTVNPVWSDELMPHKKETCIILRNSPLLILATHLIQFLKHHGGQS